MEMGSGSTGGGDSPRGLKFGKKVFFENLGSGGSSSSAAPPSAAAGKRGKSVAQGQQQPPRCQVEGCGVDLTGSKAYYCRHKVCGTHSKSPKVVVAGMEQRFCQQCSRFHQLQEFDQGKRSCRRRLAGHNERRRKPVLGTMGHCLAPPALPPFEGGGGGRFGGFLMDFSSHPRLPATPEEVWASVRVDGGGPGTQWLGSSALLPSSGGTTTATSLSHPYLQALPRGTLFSSQGAPPGEGFGVSDSGCALSLLSTQPWGSSAPAAAAATRNPPPAAPGGSYGGQLGAAIAADFGATNDSWSMKGHEGGGTSGTHVIPPEQGLGRLGEPPGEAAQFSSELELALQGSKPCLDSGPGRAYGFPSSRIQWPQ
ncbi:unnamed protein product [Spirodela intermedia]|uniref:SBP-type domain-containing protein n=1 Tax=Spirodela intermedia TaxID=51605 RepID=A0A7I8JRC2_SPIIN|nr:unnamed protein product [Spirodela intermedia]CAA6672315.1 unnamed protein product [Spirodela intermedia]